MISNFVSRNSRSFPILVPNSGIQWQETNGHYPHQPVVTELEGRISKAEAALRDKEDENVLLKQQLEQYERKWSEYEAKMKSMEEAWKRQLSSLQVIIYVVLFSFSFACSLREWGNSFLAT